MVWWLPDRLAERTDRERGRLDRAPEEEVESSVDVQAHPDSLAAAERSLDHRWTEVVPREVFVAALRALADALSQDRFFRFSVNHRFMLMRPIGTPSIEYYERENERKALTLRFSWEA